MADKSIGELPVSQSMTDDALLVVYQNGDTQSIEGALVKKYARDAVGQYVDDAAQAAETAQSAAGEAQGAAEASKENADKTAADVLVVEAAADAERERVANEAGRVAEEEKRASAEGERTAAETDRKMAETVRDGAEEARKAAEQDRAAAEEGRASAEGERTTQEETRVQVETARIQAEEARATQEESRQAGETARNTAEGLRADGEQARTAAEQARESQEDTRKSQETTRQSAEEGREAAEGERAAQEEARSLWEPYDPAKGYVAGNKVAFNGSSYLCVGACTGKAPTDAAYWLLIAAKGVDGEGTGDMLAGTYDPQAKAQDVFAYADDGRRVVHYRDCSTLTATDSLQGFFATCKATLDKGNEVFGEMGFVGGVTDCPAEVTTKSMVYIHQVADGVYHVTVRNADASPHEWFKLVGSVTPAGTYTSLTAWAQGNGVGKADAGHTHTAGEVGARPSTWTPGASEVGADPAGSAAGVQASLTTHTNDTTKHVTAEERAGWNGKAGIFGPVTVSVPVGSWAGADPWTQTVSVAGVTAADNGLTVCPVDIADNTAREAYKKAYACLAVEAETVSGGIKLTCRDGKPETTFSVVVKGVR